MQSVGLVSDAKSSSNNKHPVFETAPKPIETEELTKQLSQEITTRLGATSILQQGSPLSCETNNEFITTVKLEIQLFERSEQWSGMSGRTMRPTHTLARLRYCDFL
jgi:hypothetical protein